MRIKSINRETDYFKNNAVNCPVPTFYGGLKLQFERLHLLIVTNFLVLSLRFLLGSQLLHLKNVKYK